MSAQGKDNVFSRMSELILERDDNPEWQERAMTALVDVLRDDDWDGIYDVLNQHQLIRKVAKKLDPDIDWIDDEGNYLAED